MSESRRVTSSVLILPLLALWALLVVGLARSDTGTLADWGTPGGALALVCESSSEPQTEAGADTDGAPAAILDTALSLPDCRVSPHLPSAFGTLASFRLPPVRASPRPVV